MRLNGEGFRLHLGKISHSIQFANSLKNRTADLIIVWQRPESLEFHDFMILSIETIIWQRMAEQFDNSHQSKSKVWTDLKFEFYVPIYGHFYLTINSGRHSTGNTFKTFYGGLHFLGITVAPISVTQQCKKNSEVNIMERTTFWH